MATTRRIFLKSSGLAMVGVGALPTWLARSAWASERGGRKQVLVAIFQRGAVDGLNMVTPYGEADYYRLRPSIALPRQELINLDGFFGLHPALGGLKPLWDRGVLGVVQAAGSPDPSRSHFDAQDFMESGTPGVKSTDDGWLNRAMGCEHSRTPSPLRAIAMGPQMPLTLQGKAPAVAIQSLQAFRVGAGPQAAATDAAFAAMYDDTRDAVLRPAGQDTFEALRLLQSLDGQKYQPANGAIYPKQELGQHLQQLAQLIKADVGVEVAFADVGGWDNHVNEGAVQGQMANNLRQFGDALAAFWQDLGERQRDVVVVTMSEFGRTVHENGDRGTDHGHANAMFVLGGSVRGGRVYGDWPGLAPEKLYQNRDLAVTTDFRDVLSEAVARHLGVSEASALAQVFPGFAANPARFRNYLRS